MRNHEDNGAQEVNQWVALIHLLAMGAMFIFVMFIFGVFVPSGACLVSETDLHPHSTNPACEVPRRLFEREPQ